MVCAHKFKLPHIAGMSFIILGRSGNVVYTFRVKVEFAFSHFSILGSQKSHKNYKKNTGKIQENCRKIAGKIEENDKKNTREAKNCRKNTGEAKNEKKNKKVGKNSAKKSGGNFGGFFEWMKLKSLGRFGCHLEKICG